MAKDRAPSETPVPTTEAAQPEGESAISEEQWTAMSEMVNNILSYRTEDGYDPSKIFQRKVNKRNVPDYYTVIKEPMAFSMIKAKISGREYKDFAEFVRDCALIPHNAQVYNIPKSAAYQDALVIKEVMEKELQKLIENKTISEETAKFPDLGEIPPVEETVGEEDAEGEEEEEEEEEEEDEEGDDSDDEGRKKRRRGARATVAVAKKETGAKDAKAEAEDAESRKKRGRPPRVDTPMEARIKEIMKGMRKPRNSANQLMISHFERLPDKQQLPDYYSEIKDPIAMDTLKKRLKRKKYHSVDQFMRDVEVMFENAKKYNEDDSQIYKDAVYLQKEARMLAEEVKKKPDTDFVMEDGRLPMPNGILHNGELWKVGDWVHIQNANDLTKPIVAQIYRTWQDANGGKWVNACWYYRPEQTVHRFDRHFLENEVVKTGQYRDHPIEEVVDRCFVMFFTRYNKGRPRNFPADKEIYVCEARYNEEKHKLNKIKTWASCLPDEVREKDYEMDLFDAPKKLKKVPSPIAYLLPKDAKETDELPKPEWGAPNAPPKIGAVHMRPRDPKESPPPEPTPSPPPPPPPPPPPRQMSNVSTPGGGMNGMNGMNGINGINGLDGYSHGDARSDYARLSGTPVQTPLAAHTPVPPHHAQQQQQPQSQHQQQQQQQQQPQPLQPQQTAYTPHHPRSFASQQHSASPAPAMTPHMAPTGAPQQPTPGFPPMTPHHPGQYSAFPPHPPAATLATPMPNPVAATYAPTPHAHYPAMAPAVPTPLSGYPHAPPSVRHSIPPPTAPTPHHPPSQLPQPPPSQLQPQPPQQQPYLYNKAPPVEVFALADPANASIPASVLARFHRDEAGRLLFFTAPPVQVVDPPPTATLGHSARYLAERKRRAAAAAAESEPKRARLESSATSSSSSDAEPVDPHTLETLLARGLRVWQDDLAEATRRAWRGLVGGHDEGDDEAAMLEHEMTRLLQRHREAARVGLERDERERLRREEGRWVEVRGLGV